MKTNQPFIVKTPKGKVSALLGVPKNIFAGLTLAHGAGAGMEHPFMESLASALGSKGFAVLRFQFPYMEAGQKRTDSPEVATATVASAAEALRREIDLPLFAGGKSFGARMTTIASACGLLSNLNGIICYGFPLHPAGDPNVRRAEHLEKIPNPLLFLQGTRDALADLSLMRSVCKELPKGKLKVIEGADHGFNVLKRSGRSTDEVIEQLAAESLEFASDLL